MSFRHESITIFTISFDQLQSALASATNQQKNQLITATPDIGLWALKSYELQIHFNHSPDTTKFLISADSCLGLQPSHDSSVQGQAFAVVQVTGVGKAFAYAEVTASGEAYAFASGTGNATAIAIAQTSVNNLSDKAYVVQPGDNLFRIAINHGISLKLLSQMNNIQDPSRIIVGQVIQLP